MAQGAAANETIERKRQVPLQSGQRRSQRRLATSEVTIAATGRGYPGWSRLPDFPRLRTAVGQRVRSRTRALLRPLQPARLCGSRALAGFLCSEARWQSRLGL